MGIARASVLAGHVLGSTIQTMAGLVVVVGVALLVGFRPDADVVEWIAAAGVLLMITLAITWLSVALGLAPEERGGREQPPDAADPAAVPQQRIRPGRVDAGWDPLVRRVPAVHARSSRRCADC